MKRNYMMFVVVAAVLLLLTLGTPRASADPMTATLNDPNVFVCNGTNPDNCGADPNHITNPSSLDLWVEGATHTSSGAYFVIVGRAPGEGVPSIAGANTTPNGTYGWDANAVALGTSNACEVLGLAPPDACDSNNASNWGSGYTVYAFEFSSTSPVIPGFSGPATSPLVLGVTNTSAGDRIIGYGRDAAGGVIATPFTTSGFVTTTAPVPDGGMTLMLLGSVLIGVETLRRRFRV